jgi:hypothetical protein
VQPIKIAASVTKLVVVGAKIAKKGSSLARSKKPWNTPPHLREAMGLMRERIAGEGADQGNVLNDSLRIDLIDEPTAEQGV